MVATPDARADDPDDPPDPLMGQVFLDRYRVVRRLGKQDAGGVYVAQHLMADRVVRIEVLDTDPAHPSAAERFLEDSRTVARIGHENVVEIFNGGRSPQGAVFLATEPLEGADLAGVLATDAPLLWERAQGIALQIAAALTAVHRHGVVHGALRPENVLLVPRAGRRDFVKLVHFGVGRVTAGGASACRAPEQIAGGAVDARADVYALGCLLYHMATGQPPAAPSNAEPLAMPSSKRPAGALPAEVDGVVLRALETDPARRWPDMASFGDAVARCRLTRRQSVRVEALAAAELSGKTNAFEDDASRRRRRGALLSVAAAVVVAIVGLRVLTTSPGHVQISTVPTDATLIFNGVPVEARSPVVLDAAPGRYTLVVARPGFVTAQRTVDVQARGTIAVPVDLVPAPSPSAAAAQPLTAPSSP
jgi:Protein kinase domain/PEGA domain